MDFARVNLLLGLVVIIGLNADIASAQTVIGTACNSSNAATVCTEKNSTCDQASSMCACQTGFDNKNDHCVVVLGKNCAAPAECTGVANATCSSTTCVCVSSFKKSGATCVPKVLKDNCAKPTDCTAVNNLTCVSSQCACAETHKEVSGQCKAKGLGDPCKVTNDCVAVKLSVCNTTTSHTCECPKHHNVVSGQCKAIGLGDKCKTDADCVAVKLSICNTTTTPTHKCECPKSIKAVNGECKTEDSSADSKRLAFSIFATCLMLTLQKRF